MFDSGWERGPGAAPTPSWSSHAPGPELAAALGTAPAIDPTEDAGFDLVERIGAYESLAAWASAEQADAAAELLAARQAPARANGIAQFDAFSSTAMELATMARVAPATGEHRLHQAFCLATRLPLTLERLRAGAIAYSHARVIIEQTQDCTELAAAAVEAEYWTGPSRERTPTQVRERIRRIILRLDPAALRRRVARARAERDVRYWSDDDGATGVISIRLPADQARGVYAVIDAAARAAADPPDTPADQRRTLGARRADAVTDLILTAASNGCAAPCEPEPTSTEPASTGPAEGAAATEPAQSTVDDRNDDGPDETGQDETGAPRPARPQLRRRQRPRRRARSRRAARDKRRNRRERRRHLGRARPAVHTQVRVLIPWQTLAGIGEQPGELEGHGPIPAATARALAADPQSTWRRLLTDPVTGTARHLDLHRYRPPGDLIAFVEDRDQYCCAPGCRRSATACDIDHVIAYDHTTEAGGVGPTHPDNHRPGCRRHHNIKTRRLWNCTPHTDADGVPAVLWTSPSGHTWIVRSPGLTEPDRVTRADRDLGQSTPDEHRSHGPPEPLAARGADPPPRHRLAGVDDLRGPVAEIRPRMWRSAR